MHLVNSFWNFVGFGGDASCGEVLPTCVLPLDRTDTCLVLEGYADRSGGQRLGGDGEGGRGVREGACDHPPVAVWIRPYQREAAPVSAAGIIVPGEAIQLIFLSH